MAPINREERRKAFLRFLLFFVITVAVIITAVLFSVEVPIKESKQLRKEVNMLQIARVEQESFLRPFETKMQETMHLLDTISLVNNVYAIDNSIKKNLDIMTAEIESKDTSVIANICRRILDNLTSLRAAKMQIRENVIKGDELDKKDREIDKLETELELYKTRVLQLLSSQSR